MEKLAKLDGGGQVNQPTRDSMFGLVWSVLVGLLLASLPNVTKRKKAKKKNRTVGGCKTVFGELLTLTDTVCTA